MSWKTALQIFEVADAKRHRERVERPVVKRQGDGIALDEFNAVVPTTRSDFLSAHVEHARADVHACDVHIQPHAHRFNGEVRRAGRHVEKLFWLLVAQDANARLAPQHVNAQ